MSDNNCLVEIPVADWPKLRDIYADKKTEAASFNLLQNFIKWLRINPSIDFVKIYSLNGDWSDGTYLLKDMNNSITFSTQNDSHDRLHAALSCLQKNETHFFSGIPDRLLSTLIGYYTELGLSLESCISSTTIWFHIDHEKALAFNTDPPEGITVSSLRQEHVKVVNDLWPFRREGSDIFINRIINFNETVAAYDQEGIPLAWCVQLPLGSLGILQVKEDHKRKGYGSLMVRALSKKLAKMGIEVTAPVVDTNEPSKGLFKGLGFQQIDKVYWIHKPAVQ